jgi:hypothetical protein
MFSSKIWLLIYHKPLTHVITCITLITLIVLSIVLNIYTSMANASLLSDRYAIYRHACAANALYYHNANRKPLRSVKP